MGRLYLAIAATRFFTLKQGSSTRATIEKAVAFLQSLIGAGT